MSIETVYQFIYQHLVRKFDLRATVDSDSFVLVFKHLGQLDLLFLPEGSLVKFRGLVHLTVFDRLRVRIHLAIYCCNLTILLHTDQSLLVSLNHIIGIDFWFALVLRIKFLL